MEAPGEAENIPDRGKCRCRPRQERACVLRGQLTAQHGDGAASEEERGAGRMLADEVRGHVGHVTEP